MLSARPPHKEQLGADIEHRLAMLDIALKDHPRMVSDDFEVRREQLSYTIDTLEHFRRTNPDSSIVLIVGSDIMPSFHLWHRYQEILDNAHLIVMHRAGYPVEVSEVLKSSVTDDFMDLKQCQNGKVFIFQALQIPISSTKVRDALNKQQNVQQWLNPAVHEYIEKHGLYQTTNNIDESV